MKNVYRQRWLSLVCLGCGAAGAPTPAAVVAPASQGAEAPRPSGPSPVLEYRGFAKPESVLYDSNHDRYLVSNVNGEPGARDNNGFISVLSPDGQTTASRWIEGGKNQVILDAPTGSALVAGVLYIADIDKVRLFDIETGAPEGEIPIPGATLLNDLAADPEGNIYVDDSGFDIDATGHLRPTSTDAIYVIERGVVRTLAKTTDLHLPNGLVWTESGLVVCSSGAPEVFRLDAAGSREDVTKLPSGRLDGVIAVGGSLLVASHEASGLLLGKLGGAFEPVILQQETPADIGYDSKRARVLVPHVMKDTVSVHQLPPPRE